MRGELPTQHRAMRASQSLSMGTMCSIAISTAYRAARRRARVSLGAHDLRLGGRPRSRIRTEWSPADLLKEGRQLLATHSGLPPRGAANTSRLLRWHRVVLTYARLMEVLLAAITRLAATGPFVFVVGMFQCWMEF